MCLLAVIHRAHPEAPLVMAANRDEWLDRPASPMGVLAESGPRILGGRDEKAGGTWLAVNEHGVVAGLTNKPRLGVRDPSKRSRGELPIRLARHRTAAEAAEAFVREVRTAEYEPCWLLVGDRETLHAIDLSGPIPTSRSLPPGVHVLENRPFEVGSPKADLVRDALADHAAYRGEALVDALGRVLASHVVPERATPPEPDDGFVRPIQTEAACVHAGPYGTRSATIVVVPQSASERPKVWSSDAPPCTSRLHPRTDLWTAPPGDTKLS